MAGYLDQYGEGEEKRNRIIAVIVLGTAGDGSGRRPRLVFAEEPSSGIDRQAFVNALQRGDAQAAYQAWGCTADKPCTAYSFDKFKEDWASKNNPTRSRRVRHLG